MTTTTTYFWFGSSLSLRSFVELGTPTIRFKWHFATHNRNYVGCAQQQHKHNRISNNNNRWATTSPLGTLPQQRCRRQQQKRKNKTTKHFQQLLATTTGAQCSLPPHVSLGATAACGRPGGRRKGVGGVPQRDGEAITPKTPVL